MPYICALLLLSVCITLCYAQTNSTNNCVVPFPDARPEEYNCTESFGRLQYQFNGAVVLLPVLDISGLPGDVVFGSDTVLLSDAIKLRVRFFFVLPAKLKNHRRTNAL
mmetsp:Transcript_4097/g.4509  ORF Transcript_4097/g.4509 Transcript_4097/m.4509 type:complete len:108 (-) Transcript_4097:283-606(-)